MLPALNCAARFNHVKDEKLTAQIQSVQQRKKIKPIRQMVRVSLEATQDNKKRARKNTFIRQNKRFSS